MRTVCIDSEFKCHLVDDGTMTAVETDRFDGKCDEYVKGHRLVPEGEIWIREDGESFTGMVAPWRDYNELDAAQREYEREKLADAENALAILWGGESE
jgi:hypothetical protein